MQNLPDTVFQIDRTLLQDRLQEFSARTGYPLKDLRYLRKVGPPPNARCFPERGSEIFVHHLPVDAFEDELFYFFRQAGDIYEIRLMLRPSGLANRGYAFIRYFSAEQAEIAMQKFSRMEFRPGMPVCLEQSVENNRLFLSGIPVGKTKDEIWQTLLDIGFTDLVEIIFYRSWNQDQENRGFVFLEFPSHEAAAFAKKQFCDVLRLWNKRMILDWAEPLKEVPASVMNKVTRLFLRNLPRGMTKEDLIGLLQTIFNLQDVEKVYKRHDYCFLHFYTRASAEIALGRLKEHFKGTDVEATWSKPPPQDRDTNSADGPSFEESQCFNCNVWSNLERDPYWDSQQNKKTKKKHVKPRKLTTSTSSEEKGTPRKALHWQQLFPNQCTELTQQFFNSSTSSDEAEGDRGRLSEAAGIASRLFRSSCASSEETDSEELSWHNESASSRESYDTALSAFSFLKI